MNAYHMARSAYSSPVAPIRDNRSTEYELFAKITARLKSALDQGNDGFPALVDAMHENRRLWTLLATDVADASNELPSQLRAQLFYLAEFTLEHTSSVLEGSASAEVLIDINTAVMRGLRQREVAA